MSRRRAAPRGRGALRIGGGLVSLALGAVGALVAVTMTTPPALAASGGTGTGYLSTRGAHLVDSTGATVRLTGLNWFGMETKNFTFHGLWASVTWKAQLDHMAELGYNTIRIPYSDEALKSGTVPTSINETTNPDLMGLSPMEILDRVVEHAGRNGMRILLDRHRPDGGSQSPLWYTATVSEATWISNMQFLARHYANNPTVIGIDLHNEPHAEGSAGAPAGACWGCGNPALDWRLAAQKAGNAVLSVNPNWLIVVEGVSCPSGGPSNEWDDLPEEDCGWWGGNLSKAREFPVELSKPNKLVYSAHEYGNSGFHQKWFEDPTFPANLPGIWDKYWGYLVKEGIAPVLIGEFGSTLEDKQGQDATWLKELMKYMGTGLNGMNFTYWAWNPNSVDTGGLVGDDWETVNTAKHSILKPYLIPPVPGQVSPDPSGSPTRTTPPGSCTATASVDSTWGGGYQATVKVKNTGTAAVSPWSVTWVLPSGVTLGSGWGGTVTQTGQTVTAVAPSHARTLAVGATASIGFTANGSSTTVSGITLNGATCR